MSTENLKNAIASGVKEDIVNAAEALPITEYSNVSDSMARAILDAKGVEVRFEEPVDVKSDFDMKPIANETPASETDADGDGVTADVDADDSDPEVQ